MRTYLRTLHQRPESHKKRFALLVSGGVTLLIFTAWSLVTFGARGAVVAQDGSLTKESNFANPLVGIKQDLKQIKNIVSNVYGGQK